MRIMLEAETLANCLIVLWGVGGGGQSMPVGVGGRKMTALYLQDALLHGWGAL